MGLALDTSSSLWSEFGEELKTKRQGRCSGSLGFAIARRAKAPVATWSAPHQFRCRVSFLDGAKYFSLPFRGCAFRGGELGRGGAKPWRMRGLR